MRSEEKRQLLALFDHEHRWCREAEAQNVRGEAVRYDDAAATAWDITGALCHLFGWHRASELFAQLDRHINGRREVARRRACNVVINSMVALQNFNDRCDMTFELVRGQLESMPIWSGPGSRASATPPTP